MHLFDNTSDAELESKKLSTVRSIACTSPTKLEASTDLAFYDTMISANTNWSVCGFKESLQYTIKFLWKSGICVNENGSDLCSIMNDVLEHDVRIGTKQHSHQVSPKGLLLLYCFAECFNCTVFLFSTRKKPTIIKPVERDGATRKFAALLSHQVLVNLRTMNLKLMMTNPLDQKQVVLELMVLELVRQLAERWLIQP
ncbi:uncharacterized protein ATC70_000269 [Mucor velutinosus]|uniref:Uncharacterized protein n=1 Tax=Mucor velutinosus TaxID=708070 RepID=A0AAN7DL02_9FUNG|nr:hypothetical protein ATC70_000269 [Mucor velutinosus]